MIHGPTRQISGERAKYLEEEEKSGTPLKSDVKQWGTTWNKPWEENGQTSERTREGRAAEKRDNVRGESKVKSW